MIEDEGIFYQPVQAYFQFAQSNLMLLDESNIDHIRREAEERRAQLMEQMVQQLCRIKEHSDGTGMHERTRAAARGGKPAT